VRRERAGRVTWFKANKVIDGAPDGVHGPSVIAVRDGTIEGVWPVAQWDGAAARCAETPSRMIDCSRLTALPGLVDAHVHITSVSFEDVFPRLPGADIESFGKTGYLDHISDEMVLLAAVRNAAELLRAGVTTVRDCGARGETPFALREGIARGWIKGPRLLISGPPITQTGGHGYFFGGEADGPEGTRKLARTLIKKGVDFLKVMATGGLATPTTNPGRASYSAPELRAVVEEAHKADLKVAAHILATEGIMTALEAGIDTFEHVWFIEPDRSSRFNPDLVKRMVDQDVVCSPTIAAAEVGRLTALKEKVRRGVATAAEAELAAWIERQLRHNLEHLIQMHEMGLRIINGTDAMGGYIPFDDYAVTLEMMVKGGLSALDAILMSTREPAKVLGVNAGVLQPGYLADIIFVDGDPLNDISSIRRVRKVFREGELLYEA